MAFRPFSSRQRGHDIESLTAQWLEQQGLITIARNHHIRGGETDLIMRDGDYLVFIEVRYRASASHGSPLETITPAKQRRLIRAARCASSVAKYRWSAAWPRLRTRPNRSSSKAEKPRLTE